MRGAAPKPRPAVSLTMKYRDCAVLTPALGFGAPPHRLDRKLWTIFDFLKDDNNHLVVPGGKSPATKTCRDGYSMLFSVLAETQSRVGRFYRITITQPGRPYYSRRNMNKRIALVSEHASPLAAIGGADTGGQNIAVAELAQHLAAIGYQIDVFTRWDDQRVPKVINWRSGIRIIHVEAGPLTFYSQGEAASPYAGFYPGYAALYQSGK